ncbi:hypothetical protein BLOT_010549 [Blomia tropicalis]|nr:hypothetical protein BLOT_010549 [Blomia tropicalis]
MKNQDVQQAHEFMIDYILSIQRHCPGLHDGNVTLGSSMTSILPNNLIDVIFGSSSPYVLQQKYLLNVIRDTNIK